MKMDRADSQEASFATWTDAAECYRLGDLVIDADSGRVLRGEHEIELPRLSWDLLLVLARAGPTILSLDELMDRVWPGLVVSPETVSQRIKLLRDALGDDAHHPRYIAGVRGRGYRLAAAVEPLRERRSSSGPASPAPGLPTPIPGAWRPLLVAALLLAMFALWRFALRPQQGTGVPATERAIAVLPFTVRAAQGEGPVFFADGIHDDLLTRLAQIPGLRVISRTSVLPYRDTSKNLRQIGEELGVGTILEGSVQQVGNQIRINAQLIDAQSDQHLWAETFDRELTVANLLAIQSGVAGAIADAMQVKVAVGTTAGTGGTDRLEAYSALLAGQEAVSRYLAQDSGDEPLRIAEDQYRRAIALDPGFARAHAGLAQAVILRSWGEAGPVLHPEQLTQGKAAAERALALVPDLPDAHLALAMYHYYGQRDYPRALGEIAQAERGMPGSARVFVVKGWILLRAGRTEEALASIRRAVDLDPRNMVAHLQLARVLRDLRRFDELDAQLERMWGLDPTHPLILSAQAMLPLRREGDLGPALRLLRQQPEALYPETRWHVALFARDWDAALVAAAELAEEPEGSSPPRALYRGLVLRIRDGPDASRPALIEARDRLRAALARSPDAPETHAWLGLALAGLGEREAALAAARHAVELLPLERDAVIGYALLDRLATVAAMVGDADAAVAALDRLLSAPGWSTIHCFRLDPRFDRIRDRPVFVALVEKTAAENKARIPKAFP